MENNQANKSPTWKEQLERLIKLVDSECVRKVYTPLRKKTVIAIAVMYFSVAASALVLLLMVGKNVLDYSSLLAQPYKLDFLASQTTSLAALSVAVVAFAFTFPYSQFKESSAKDWATWYYYVLSRKHKINRDELPILKALINMHCKEFGVSIWEVYKNCELTNSDLFSKDSLLRSLYD